MKQFSNIIKPEQDTRLYRGLKLDNGLTALLISDSETDMSAAALSVHVGTFVDPESLLGLAHFNEHMLFMGSKKYPTENEYLKFLSQNGGESNAYTDTTCTTYYFDVSPDQLSPALDRFAQFFIDPLMIPESITREMEALNSEYQKNKDQDGWREDQIERLLSDPTHDFHKFNIGSLETLRDIPTLKGVNIRDELLKFNEQWYSSNIMYLAVLGRESLDELEAIVSPMFSPIVNRNVQCKTWDHPYKAEQLMRQVSLVPIKDKRCMTFKFVYPDEVEHYKSSPGHYISHLIGHEGHGSLLSELKGLGLISNLAACTDSIDGFGSFTVSTELTEDGLHRTDEIAKHLFQYINMLKTRGPKEYIFNELKDLSFINFNFMEKSNPISVVERLSAKLHYYPIEEILSAKVLVEEWRPDLITEMMSYLKPENCIIKLVSKAFDGKTDKVEHFFGVNYKVQPFSENLLNSIKNAGLNPKFELPAPNELIPTDFKLFSDKKDESRSKYPAKIMKNEIAQTWFLQDWVYLKPKVFYGLRMVNPINLRSANVMNCHILFSMLFIDELTEYLYDARLAGLSFEFIQDEVGYTLQFFGYNHKMSCFLKQVFKQLVEYKIDAHRFAIQKERYQRGIKSFKTQPLFKLINYYNGLIIYEGSFTYEEKIAALDELTLEACQEYWAEFVKQMHVDILAYGNIDRAGAETVTKIFNEEFLQRCNTKPLPAHLPRLLREVQLPAQSSHLYEAVNEIHTMKCTLNYYQVGNVFEDRCALYIIDQIIDEPFFDYMRTKEQLGYIVWSKYHEYSGIHGMLFLIQSQFGAKYLDRRIEAFLAYAQKYIQDMSEPEFEKEKASLITKLLKKKKRLFQFAIMLWNEIERQEFKFDYKERIVAAIKGVSKNDVCKMFERTFFREAPGRQKISVRINCHKAEENLLEPSDECKKGIIPEVAFKDPVLINDHKNFKSSLKYYPLPSAQNWD